MPLENFYYITEICVGIAFVISILFMAMQIRQNSALLRHSMSLNRKSNAAWLMREIATDADFRDFHRRIERDYKKFNADEKYRADAVAFHNLTSNLDELVAYKRGLITNDEWISLKYVLEFTATRPNIQATYERVKHQYRQDVRDFWEALPKHTDQVQPMVDAKADD
jgi:hypothetical protein